MKKAKEMLRVGTRGSLLALAQAEAVLDRLVDRAHLSRDEIEVVRLQSAGDRFPGQDLIALDAKGVFVKELEDQLLEGNIDLAVHSLKDLQTDLPQRLCIGAVLPRLRGEDILCFDGKKILGGPRDVEAGKTFSLPPSMRLFPSSEISPLPLWERGTTPKSGAFWGPRVRERGDSFEWLKAIPAGSCIGSGSLRRRAQLLSLRPDLKILPIRGNVDTRLRKMKEGVYDAIVLSAAGVERLGIEVQAIPLPIVPAVGQGGVVIEVLQDREDLKPILEKITDRGAFFQATVERAALKALQGGCLAPIGIHCALGVSGSEAFFPSPSMREGHHPKKWYFLGAPGQGEGEDAKGAEAGSYCVEGVVVSLDGEREARAKLYGRVAEEEAASIGERLAQLLIERGAKEILEDVRNELKRKELQ